MWTQAHIGEKHNENDIKKGELAEEKMQYSLAVDTSGKGFLIGVWFLL